MSTKATKLEEKLLQLVNFTDKLLREEESAAEKAKKMGLTSMGFGRWGKDGKVTHKTDNGQLKPVEKDEEPAAQQKQGKDGEAEKKPVTPAGPEKPATEKQPASAGDKAKQPEAPKDPGEQKAQQAMPKAKLSGKPLKAIPKEQLQQVATRIDDLAKMGQEAKEKGEKAPNFNLCQVSIPGTNLFCGDNKGIPRAEMPQFKGQPQPGSMADRLPKDKDGEVDTEEFFKKMLEKQGIKVSEPTTVPPDRLKATQSELVGVKVAGMSKVLADKNHPAYGKITAPIYVSRDGYVLDGHHRWAAIVAHNASNPDNQIDMQVRVIDDDIIPLVKRSNDFAEEVGIRAKAADTGAAGDGKAADTKPDEKRPKFKNWPEPKKGIGRKFLDKIKSWGKEEAAEAKTFFKEELHKGSSPERRTMIQKGKDKIKGSIKAIKKGFKHEGAVFRDAGRGIRSFFRGKKPNQREQHAMKDVAIKVVTTALFGAALGGTAHGAAYFAKHVMMEFIPHVVGETVLKGAGKAALFAGPEDNTDEKMMEKFIEKVMENLETMDIPPEILEKAIESYKPENKTEK